MCWGYYLALCDGGALREALCVHRVCVCVAPPVGGFLLLWLRPSSLGCGLLPIPYLCVDKVLAVVNDAYEFSLSKLCE